MTLVSMMGIIFSGILYLIVGGFGYATYGNNTNSNFILNFKPENIQPVLYIMLNIT
jgi:amino acid permease